jgi:hypothetical protein
LAFGSKLGGDLVAEFDNQALRRSTNHHRASLVEISHITTQRFVQIGLCDRIDRCDRVDATKVPSRISRVAAQLIKRLSTLIGQMKKWRIGVGDVETPS